MFENLCQTFLWNVMTVGGRTDERRHISPSNVALIALQILNERIEDRRITILKRMGLVSEKHKTKPNRAMGTTGTPLRLLTWNIRYDWMTTTWMRTPVTAQKVRLKTPLKADLRKPPGQNVEEILSPVLNSTLRRTG